MGDDDMVLSNNQDLNEFLVELRKWLVEKKRADLADMIPAVTETAFTTSSEYLGEARAVLSKVQAAKIRNLSSSMDDEIRQAINQIDLAFRRANGLIS
jgi:hypothetical protein